MDNLSYCFKMLSIMDTYLLLLLLILASLLLVDNDFLFIPISHEISKAFSIGTYLLLIHTEFILP